jgi:hypothetical protein
MPSPRDVLSLVAVPPWQRMRKRRAVGRSVSDLASNAGVTGRRPANHGAAVTSGTPFVSLSLAHCAIALKCVDALRGTPFKVRVAVLLGDDGFELRFT